MAPTVTVVEPVAFFTWNAQTFAERFRRRGLIFLMAALRPFLYSTNRKFATRVVHTALQGVTRDRLDLLGEEYFQYKLKPRLKPHGVEKVQEILQRLRDEKRIYKDKQAGYYSVRQEQFLTDKERGPDGEFGPEWGEVEFREEENYYFKLSEHKEWLLGYLKNHPDCVAPSFRQTELINAVEAMSEVGDRPRELTIVAGKGDSNELFVEVQDTGPGLDQANLDRLFHSFYTTKPEGMGMGLAISRSIVEAHGGRLSAAPNEPHGAVFRFSLPVGGEAVHADT